jgi:hypothetical protein
MKTLFGSWGWVMVALWVLSPLAGCALASDAVPFLVPPGVESADIALSWSIDGDSSGALCAQHGAAQVEIIFTDDSGAQVDDWTLPCALAATNEPLGPGLYDASATLEDVNGNPVTTTATTEVSFSSGMSPGPVDFDFEEASFTNGT